MIVSVLALLVIAIALPFAIVDTFETGRVYVFSRQFLDELPRRFTGPGRLRFILQPMVAIVLEIRGGLADVKAGNPPYLFGLLFSAGRRESCCQAVWRPSATWSLWGSSWTSYFNGSSTARCIRVLPW